MKERPEDAASRGEMRLIFAALFMHAEIPVIGVDVSNEELAARGLRRADMLLKLDEAA